MKCFQYIKIFETSTVPKTFNDEMYLVLKFVHQYSVLGYVPLFDSDKNVDDIAPAYIHTLSQTVEFVSIYD